MSRGSGGWLCYGSAGQLVQALDLILGLLLLTLRTLMAVLYVSEEALQVILVFSSTFMLPALEWCVFDIS